MDLLEAGACGEMPDGQTIKVNRINDARGEAKTEMMTEMMKKHRASVAHGLGPPSKISHRLQGFPMEVPLAK